MRVPQKNFDVFSPIFVENKDENQMKELKKISDLIKYKSLTKMQDVKINHFIFNFSLIIIVRIVRYST